uniref:Glucosylceramidase n=1 Tax=Meloidogyne floridensis TaxID=298350 RepID=A0A915NLV3_9BILA
MIITLIIIFLRLLIQLNAQINNGIFPQEIPIKAKFEQLKWNKTKNIFISKNSIENTQKCFKRHFSADSFVCVCNSIHCDQPEEIGEFTGENAYIYQTDPIKQRLNKKELKIIKRKNKRIKLDLENTVKIRINASQQYQKILGFGGAFTDAVGYNLNLLSKKTRMQLLRTYFDKNIVYSYCDTDDDFKLKTFALSEEDLHTKASKNLYQVLTENRRIPHILTANILAGSPLSLIATSWSAPAWMKTSRKMPGGGSLRGKLDGPFYHTYAHYLRRFFEEYSNLANITFWGMTIENEPQYGLDPWYKFQAMWVSPETQRDFANNILSPILKSSPATKNLLLMGHDDNRNYILDAANKIFRNKNSTNIIAGLAYHWYSFSPHSVLSEINNLYPDKFLLGSEACAGWAGVDQGVSLGNWTRAMMYGRDILRGLQNWAIGWTDWNLCLDLIGGPNWVKNYADSPIIINVTADEFYKQPMFYAMAHFSRFIPPGSIRIDSQISSKLTPSLTEQIESVAFRNPDGNRVLVLISNSEELIEGIIEEEINENNKGLEAVKIRTINVRLPPKSISTLIWPKRNSK